MNIEIFGDSAEYEYLTDGVAMSANVEGACIEIGSRRCMGIKYIADAVRIFCPDKPVISVDPYGSLEYEHREGQICRLDYTNQMKLEGWGAAFAYLCDNPVNFIPINMTDTDFFVYYADGVPIYELERRVETKYSFCHLDGPHGGLALAVEIRWFDERMDVGAVICVDDVTIDFIDFTPVDALFVELGWKQVKIGGKKALYIKN